MKSETAKLPKGHSYPIKPSVLEAALAQAGIEIDTHLIRGPSELFDAHFRPPNGNVPYERLYVRAGSVPAGEAANERARVEDVLIPALVEWIGGILTRDPRSPVRRKQQYRRL